MAEKTTMKAIILTGDRRFDYRDVPIPKPGRGQAVMRIHRAAICGSDMHFYQLKPEFFTYPDTISGHEPAGVIHEVGEDVSNLHVGQRVCVYHFHGCNNCEHCSARRYNLCETRLGLGWEIDGANTEYLVMNAECFLPLPDELSMEDGVIISCIGASAYSALRKLEASGRHLLAIYGVGAVGLAALVMAKAMGATVVGIEKNPYRIEMAKRLGCDYVIDGTDEDACKKLIEISGGHGLDISLETSGMNHLRKMAAKAAAIHGKVALVGFDADTKNKSIEILSHFDTRDVIRKELMLMGSSVMPLDMYGEMVRFLARKKVRLDSIVTHHFPLDRFQDAVDLFYTGNSGKIVIDAV